jgi:uncharacterized protein (TIGR03085 family)
VPRFAVTERTALAQTLRAAGPESATLCGEWNTAELAAHLVLRERSLVELGGRVPVAPLQRAAERAVERFAAATPYPEIVDGFERGPSWREPSATAWLWALPPVREAANLVEYVVHHEDVRRAADTWEPRRLTADMQAALWNRLRLMARLTLRSVPLGVVLRCGHGEIANGMVGRGAPTVTVSGPPVELALFALGRQPVARVEYAGAAGDIAAVRGADLSV